MCSSVHKAADMASLNLVMNAVTKRPLLFNSVVGYGVFAGGDILAQRMESGGTTEWDHRRSLSIGLLGILQNGILLRLWYRTLDRFVTPKVGPSVESCYDSRLTILFFFVTGIVFRRESSSTKDVMHYCTSSVAVCLAKPVFAAPQYSSNIFCSTFVAGSLASLGLGLGHLC